MWVLLGSAGGATAHAQSTGPSVWSSHCYMFGLSSLRTASFGYTSRLLLIFLYQCASVCLRAVGKVTYILKTDTYRVQGYHAS